MKNIKISIIIINYNGGQLLNRCVESIKKNIIISFEIIIIDNGSQDNSIEKFIDDKNVKVILNNDNLGFSKANNIGASISNGELIHFLNPDCIINESINEVYRFHLDSRQDNVGVTNLKYEDGSSQKSKHIIPNPVNIFKKILHLKKVNYWYLGASIIVPKKIFLKIGGWSEEFFMYAEDLDFFHKVNKINIPIFEHKQSIIHLSEGITKIKWKEMKRFELKEKSTKKFFKKNFSITSYQFSFLLLLFYRIIFIPKLAKLQIRYLFKSEK